MDGLMSFKRCKVVRRFKLRNSASAGETFHKTVALAVRCCTVICRQDVPAGNKRLLCVLPVFCELTGLGCNVADLLANRADFEITSRRRRGIETVWLVDVGFH